MGQSSIVSTTTKLEYGITYNPLAPRHYIDLAQCLSIVNRRSYRQGMNYAVASIEVFAATGGNVAVQTIPHTWVADNATTKAYEAWREQRAEVLKEQPSLKARWSDFKLFMDATHSTAGVAGNMIPHDASGIAYNVGEWDASQYVVPLPGADQAAAGDAKEVTFHVTGNHTPAGTFEVATTTSVGLIKAYAASRALPLAPDPATEGQYISGFYNVNSLPDELSEDVMANVADHNDNPPYDLNDYPGGDANAPTPEFIDGLIVRNWGDASQSSSDTCGPFIAPFGLICLNINQFTADTSITVLVNLVPGKYKGILAERGV
jgi:hypothetical protein